MKCEDPLIPNMRALPLWGVDGPSKSQTTKCAAFSFSFFFFHLRGFSQLINYKKREFGGSQAKLSLLGILVELTETAFTSQLWDSRGHIIAHIRKPQQMIWQAGTRAGVSWGRDWGKAFLLPSWLGTFLEVLYQVWFEIASSLGSAG